MYTNTNIFLKRLPEVTFRIVKDGKQCTYSIQLIGFFKNHVLV